MNTKTFFIKGIVASVVFFLLGWLLYATLLTNFFSQHGGSATGVNRNPAEMLLWAIALGNLGFGFLLGYVLTKTGVSSAASGLSTGAAVGFFSCLGFDFIMYGTTNLMDQTGTIADIAVFTIMSAITGAIAGAVGNGARTTSAT